MKKNVGMIVLISVISLSALMGFRQYQKENKAKESESQTEISWDTSYGKATIKKVADLDESGNPIYDTSKKYYKNYDDTGLETCKIADTIGYTYEEAIKQLRESNTCKYVYMVGNEYIELKLTKEQKEQWIKLAKQNINDATERWKSNALCKLEVNDDYTRLIANISKNCNAADFVESIDVIFYNEQIIQLFSGKDEWSVNFIVKNINTGYELVNVNYPQEEWEISSEMWDE
mgnify:FL=1